MKGPFCCLELRLRFRDPLGALSAPLRGLLSVMSSPFFAAHPQLPDCPLSCPRSTPRTTPNTAQQKHNSETVVYNCLGALVALGEGNPETQKQIQKVCCG